MHIPWSGLWSVYSPQPEILIQQLTHRLEKIETTALETRLPLQPHNRTAIISLKGLMVKHAAGAFDKELGLVSTTALTTAVKQATSDPNIDQIILQVDSPGGSVEGLAELGDAIKVASTQKIVTAHIDGLAASAAFYAISQATTITAGRMDLVGAIGTRLMLYDCAQQFEQQGIKAIAIDSGPYKSAGCLGLAITEDQQQDFKRLVNGYFEDFVATVAKGRNLSIESVLKAADGRVFFAKEALTLGLIDAISNTEQPTLGYATQTAQRRLQLLKKNHHMIQRGYLIS